MNLLEAFLEKQQKQLMDNRIRLHTIGRVEELPSTVFQKLNEVKKATSHFEENHLVLALNYGARNEIIDAVKRYSEALIKGKETVHELNWDKFRHYLDTSDIPDPELVIRTSGEQRISNFLLLQSAYSEYVFSPVCWPDFGPALLESAIEDYKNRERRFGKTGEQVQKEQTISLKSGSN